MHSMLSGNETKPGLLTTEFWVAVVLPWLVTAADNAEVINVVPERWRFVLPAVSMLASGLYALSRGRAKAGIPYNPNTD